MNYRPAHTTGLDKEALLQKSALVFVYGFAFFAPWSTTGGQLFHGLLFLLTGYFAWHNRQWFFREPIVWVTLLFILYVTLRGWWGGIERPDLAAEHWEGVRRWLRAGPVAMLVVAVGLAATGSWRRHAFGILAAFIVGLLIYLGTNLSMPHIRAALEGAGRYDFNHAATITGVIVASAALMALALGTLLWQRKARLNRLVWSLLLLLWSGTLSALLIALLVTKTRSAWLGFLVALLVSLACFLWWNRRQLAQLSRQVGFGSLVAILLLGSLTAAYWDQIMLRWQPANQALVQTLEVPFGRDVETVKYTSIGDRAAYLEFSTGLFRERPWIGHGPAPLDYLLVERELPTRLGGSRGGNLHSSYSQVLVSMGAIGFLLLSATFLLVFHAAWQLGGRGDLGQVLALLAIGSLVLFTVWGLGNQGIERFRIIPLYSVAFGTTLAASLCRTSARDGEPTHNRCNTMLATPRFLRRFRCR